MNRRHSSERRLGTVFLSLVFAAVAPALFATIALAQAQSVAVGAVGGGAGEQVTFGVSLQSGTSGASGVQVDIAFDSAVTPIVRRADGSPDCTVNVSIDKPNTEFAFLPSGCVGSGCTQVRAMVVSLSSTAAITGNSQLFSCRVAISAAAQPGIYPLVPTGSILADAVGAEIPSTGTAGYVAVQSCCGC